MQWWCIILQFLQACFIISCAFCLRAVHMSEQCKWHALSWFCVLWITGTTVNTEHEGYCIFGIRQVVSRWCSWIEFQKKITLGQRIFRKKWLFWFWLLALVKYVHLDLPPLLFVTPLLEQNRWELVYCLFMLWYKSWNSVKPVNSSNKLC